MGAKASFELVNCDIGINGNMIAKLAFGWGLPAINLKTVQLPEMLVIPTCDNEVLILVGVFKGRG